MLRMTRKQSIEKLICKMPNCPKKMPKKLSKRLNKSKLKQNNSKRRKLCLRKFWKRRLRSPTQMKPKTNRKLMLSN